MITIYMLKVKHPTDASYRTVHGYFTRTDAIGTANNYLKEDYSVIIQPVQRGK